MHTDIAREALNENHSETRNALRIIRSTTEDMMAQLRNIVATLRQESPRSHTGSEGTAAIKALPDLFAS
ncbi:histidine kinase, partial [Varibaculum cambriense]|nr:histidine kinase [Varibaculum cambriense]